MLEILNTQIAILPMLILIKSNFCITIKISSKIFLVKIFVTKVKSERL
jgi:hypothetical protein